MPSFRSFLIFLALQVGLVQSVVAGDFDWLRELEIRAKDDSSGYQVALSTRFKIGDADVKLVLSNVDRPSDAYMVLRLCEMSRHPTDYVIKHYHAKKHRGWGAMAKSLGIKPGSSEFHALKAGHDLQGGRGDHHGDVKRNKHDDKRNHARG